MAKFNFKKAFAGKDTKAEEAGEKKFPKKIRDKGESLEAPEKSEGYKAGGKCYAKGGSVGFGDGVAQRGRTRGKNC